jgi:NADPH:quinone reductase-like Zn-dependent oxidoreductase
MKALAFAEHGGLDKLAYRDVPDPAIGAGDVLVKVRACALNHLDLFVREGLPGLKLPLPFWSGCDIAGEVAQVGAAVQGVAAGDRVAVNPNLHCGRCEYCGKGETSLCVSYGILGEHTYGGLAELVKVAGDKVVKLPDAVKYEDVAAFVLVNMTAWRMLVTQARLRAGEDLLVIGVGGGVVVDRGADRQALRRAGVVTSSSDDKLARARAARRRRVHQLREGGLGPRDRAEDRSPRRGRGARQRGHRDLAGRDPIARQGRTARDLRWHVRAHLRDRRPPVFWKQISIIGSTMSTNAEFAEVMGPALPRPPQGDPDSVVPLADGVAAQQKLAEGKQFGKIVLVP